MDDQLEARVRKDQPLRTIRRLVNDALLALEVEFAALCSGLGRPSVAPEKLLDRVGWAFTFSAAAYT